MFCKANIVVPGAFELLELLVADSPLRIYGPWGPRLVSECCDFFLINDRNDGRFPTMTAGKVSNLGGRSQRVTYQWLLRGQTILTC